jgi:hypothetical protein
MKGGLKANRVSEVFVKAKRREDPAVEFCTALSFVSLFDDLQVYRLRTAAATIVFRLK